MGGKKGRGNSRGAMRVRRGATCWVGKEDYSADGKNYAGRELFPCARGLTLAGKEPSRSDILHKARDLSDELERARLCESSNFDPDISPESKIEKGEFHTWIEDKQGNIVFDPHFFEYDLMKECRGIEKDAKRVHYKFTNQDNCVKIAMRRAIERAIEVDGLFGTGRDNYFWEPRHGFCNLNCYNHMKRVNGKEKGYKVVVGAMGWEEDGSVHVEYG